MEFQVNSELVLSGLSLLFTGYFWLVRVRDERPNLEFHQLSNFRANCRSIADRPGVKQLGLQQLGTGGVLIVNHSIRQNSVVRFECFLPIEDGNVIEGDWGYSGDDTPPWNIGPETSLAFSPACFFEVPEDYMIPDDLVFYLRFATASGKTFTHRFTKQVQRQRSERPFEIRSAA